MSAAELHAQLSSEGVGDDPFKFLGDVARTVAIAEADAATPREPELLSARELVIRLIEHRESLGEASDVHDALLSKLGLFPYLDPVQLAGPDLVAYEAHRPLDELEEDLVWHRRQGEVYSLLMDGKNLIVSAPTSFGKSKVVDGLLASERYRRIVIVVPTLALIDETRRRLSRLFGDSYKVVTHASQKAGEKTVYVLTQERLLEFDDLPTDLDLFVLDEFYKLQMEEDEDRARLLNQAFYRLLQTGAQFYLLGPNVGGIAPQTLSQLKNCVYIDSWDTMVAVDVMDIKGTGRRKTLIATCQECAERGEQTLVYCSSPTRAEMVAGWLREADVGQVTSESQAASEWLAANVHPEWRVAESLGSGIGVHHGRMPRALGHYMVSAFRRKKVQFLCCTSTIIEGVNTTAKNIVVYDHKIGRRALDLFTFNNIRGRGGRMPQHVTGRVYVYEAEPDPPLEEIDIPILSQPESAPAELFIGLPGGDLNQGSQDRLDAALSDLPVPRSVVESVSGISIEKQIQVAETIDSMGPEQARDLSWKGPYPTAGQLRAVLEVVWEALNPGPYERPFGVGSTGQLVAWMGVLENSSTRELIDNQIERDSSDVSVDSIILNVLRFQRSGLSFEVPKWIKAIDAMQRYLLPEKGVPAGNYEAFVPRIENLFLPPPLGALDEYGIPLELIRQLLPQLPPAGAELDDVLGILAKLDGEVLGLDEFERQLLTEAQTDLGV